MAVEIKNIELCDGGAHAHVTAIVDGETKVVTVGTEEALGEPKALEDTNVRILAAVRETIREKAPLAKTVGDVAWATLSVASAEDVKP